jgi:hypothetical protein
LDEVWETMFVKKNSRGGNRDISSPIIIIKLFVGIFEEENVVQKCEECIDAPDKFVGDGIGL